MKSLLVFLISLPLFGLSSPGDSVGWTKYDYQRNGQTGWQVWYDGSCVHVDFMRAHDSQPWPDRCCAYNFWRNRWFGDSCAGASGYVALGVKPSNNAAVCSYHHQTPGDIYRSWVSVDEGQGCYIFTGHKVLPQEQEEQLIWARLAIDDQDNFHMMLHSYDYERIYYTRSTDDGVTWSDKELVYEESQANQYRNLDGGVFADRFQTPGKIIRYWTEWTGEGSGGIAQHAQDVCYQISTDYGNSWGPKVNLTQYQPDDTMRAYCQIKAIFDQNGDPHIIFPVCNFINNQYYNKSWIIHWSPNTGFSIVTGPHSMSKEPGGWRLPCDFANIALDRDNGWLYSVYVLNRDTDTSQGGWPNGELMAKYSTDNGATWISRAQGDTGVNLTRTPTPGAPPGECCDDDYPSMHPYVETINGRKCLIISYLEDKDAGGLPQGEGTETDNPYRVYFCPVDSIIGVKEKRAGKTPSLKIPTLVYGHRLKISGLKGSSLIELLDILGRRVLSQTVSPQKSYLNLKNLRPGVYFLRIEKENHRLYRFVLIR